MSKARKALVALAGVLAVFSVALEDGDLTGGELTNVGIAIVTAVGVYLAPNKQA